MPGSLATWSPRSVLAWSPQLCAGLVASGTDLVGHIGDRARDARYIQVRPGVSFDRIFADREASTATSGNGRVHSPSTTLPSVYTKAWPLPTVTACSEPGVELAL